MIKFAKDLSTYLHILVNSSKIFNHKCWLCLDEKALNPHFCRACCADLPLNTHYCDICALPLVDSGLKHTDQDAVICGECLTSLPPFSSTIAPFIYRFPVNRIIQNAKYHNQRYWLSPLILELTNELKRCEKPFEPSCIIAIPSDKQTLNKRGFNQALDIAKALSKATDIELLRNVLVKPRTTVRTATLNKTQRKRTLKSAFEIQNERNLVNKHVYLVDDVVTTKATCEAASQLLLDAGAARVQILCLARTPKMNV